LHGAVRDGDPGQGGDGEVARSGIRTDPYHVVEAGEIADANGMEDLRTDADDAAGDRGRAPPGRGIVAMVDRRSL
jgi:hypothetical protein